ncbi:hypothetical protein D4764_04G0001190 [Takifugu flavidus]|uniref:Uncharacterized protein n=1 Tax=Takifugu flavidus TaxID=433684 RepID=A0A5C6N1T1_9TELE|nr:hypothetical protein D4764_04G0001190 [Takifugu flavidus]
MFEEVRHEVKLDSFSKGPLAQSRVYPASAHCAGIGSSDSRPSLEEQAVDDNRWCSPEHIHVKERVCSPDVELIAIGLRPYYLPREFTNVIAITVYIPPTGKADSACDVIHSVTADLQTKHPGAFILITGDFNHASLKSTLPTFHQYVQTGDFMLMSPVHTPPLLPPLGKSDHNLVLLSPSYTPVVQQQPVTTVSDYIKFYTENSVPTKKKKRGFTAGDPAELRRAQKELKRSLKESKDAYRKKLEERLERNQTRDVWSGMKQSLASRRKEYAQLMGICPNIPLDNNGSPSHLPEPLTPLPTSSPSPPLLTPYMDSSMSPIPPTGLSFTSGQVRRELERLNQRKAAGPDGISPRVLKNCPRQLCGILQHLFNQSLHLQRIPVLWKTSCLVPVPKKTHPVAPSDYRPIALTSPIMKVMERLVLSHTSDLW